MAPDSFSDNSAKSLNNNQVKEALSEEWVKQRTILVGPDGFTNTNESQQLRRVLPSQNLMAMTEHTI
jgi:hypothetical protein